MKKAILVFCIAAACAASAFAQTSSPDEYKKTEFFAGYSNGQVRRGENESFNGFNGSAVYNFSRYFGIKGDMSGTYDSDRINLNFITSTGTSTQSFKSSRSLYNFLGGIQVKDNSTDGGRFKPFAHALIGAAYSREKLKDFTCTSTGTGACPASFPVGTFSDTGLSGVLGGGLDIKLNNKIQIRAIQFDYNPMKIAGSIDHNMRIGAGIVF
jgi:hypothetical protein